MRCDLCSYAKRSRNSNCAFCRYTNPHLNCATFFHIYTDIYSYANRYPNPNVYQYRCSRDPAHRHTYLQAG
jgi:hypothetical protein